MPTGQPAVRLHGRAAARAEQLGMERIAVSITHESDYAVAIAFGIRTAGGRYVFPPDIEDRLDEQRAADPGPDGPSPGARRRGRPCLTARRPGRAPAALEELDDRTVAGAAPGAAGARPQGHVRQAARHRRLARLRRCRPARLPGAPAGPAPDWSPWPSPSRSSRCSRPRSSRRRRWPCPRTTSRRSSPTTRSPGSSTRSTTRSSSGRASAPDSPRPSSSPASSPSRTTAARRRPSSTPRPSARWPSGTSGGSASGGRAS